jgi:hypothetical protein
MWKGNMYDVVSHFAAYGLQRVTSIFFPNLSITQRYIIVGKGIRCNWSRIQNSLSGLHVLGKWHFNGNTKHTESEHYMHEKFLNQIFAEETF